MNKAGSVFLTDGDTIPIGTPGTTFMTCAEPAGIMQQEQEFLAALTSVATCRIEGNILDMHMADGARAMTLQRAP
jgi:heat shock protein HslJ